MAPNNIDLELNDTPSWRNRSQVLSIGNLVIEDRDGELIVWDRVSGKTFSLIEVLETSLSAEVAADFTYLPAVKYRPRITIDSLIVGRETWTFSPEEVAFASLPRGAEQFVEARRWTRENRLPNRIFVKIPEETKPVYIDLTSPLSVEILARLSRQASILVVSEMLPDLDQLWLRDSSGDRFTSELRIVAVDSKSWERDS